MMGQVNKQQTLSQEWAGLLRQAEMQAAGAVEADISSCLMLTAIDNPAVD